MSTAPAAAPDATTGRLLTPFFAARMPGADGVQVTSVDVVGFGHSATNWSVDVAWHEAGEPRAERFLVRRQTAGGWYDRPRENEFRLLRALHEGTSIPVPVVRWFDDTTLDTPFVVHEWIDATGDHHLLRDPARPESDRRQLFDQFLEILVQIHSVSWRDFELDFLGVHRHEDGLVTAATYEDPAARHTALILHTVDEMGDRFVATPIIERAVDWLAANQPTPARVALVHGDFGPHNALVREAKVLAMVDWEFATVGDPVEDLAWFTIRGRTRRDSFRDTVISEHDFLRMYGAAAGFEVDPASLRWWQVFGILRNVVGRAREQCRTRLDAPSSLDPDWRVAPITEDERMLRSLLGSGP